MNAVFAVPEHRGNTVLGFGKRKISTLNASAGVLLGLVWQPPPDALRALSEMIPDAPRSSLIRELVCLQYFAASLAVQDCYEKTPDLKVKVLRALDLVNAGLCDFEQQLAPQVPQAVIDAAKTFTSSTVQQFLSGVDQTTRDSLEEAFESAPNRSFFTARLQDYDNAFLRRDRRLKAGLELAGEEFAWYAKGGPDVFVAGLATVVAMSQFAAVRDLLASYRIR